MAIKLQTAKNCPKYICQRPHKQLSDQVYSTIYKLQLHKRVGMQNNGFVKSDRCSLNKSSRGFISLQSKNTNKESTDEFTDGNHAHHLTDNIVVLQNLAHF